MSVLADWEIRDLAVEKDMISPFVDHLESERDGKKILSYGLSSYGYDIRLSPQQCLVFGKIQAGDCVLLATSIWLLLGCGSRAA
jgi:deoxycytidine triphosphate deaminase